jgi:hypothetical protein
MARPREAWTTGDLDTENMAAPRGTRDVAARRALVARTLPPCGHAGSTEENSKFLNCATKTLDTKVVDETLAFNYCKGPQGFR